MTWNRIEVLGPLVALIPREEATMPNLPDGPLTFPVVKAWIEQTPLSLCGCAEWGASLMELRRLLEAFNASKKTDWYTTVCGSTGMFYLMAALLDHAGLLEHGTSCRYPWLTSDGKRLLAYLQATSAEEVEAEMDSFLAAF